MRAMFLSWLLAVAAAGPAATARGAELPAIPATASAAQPDTPGAAPTLLVLKTRVTGKAAESIDATTVTNVATTVFTESGRYKVSSYEDVVAMLDAEQQKQLAGCDDVSCMADIGAALGTQFLLYTQVGEAGGVTVVSASVIDAAAGKATERQSVPLQSPSQVVDGVRVACKRLLGEQAALGAAPDDEGSFDLMVVAWPALGVGALAAAVGLGGTGAALYFRQQAIDAATRADFDGYRDAGHTANTVALASYATGGVLVLAGGIAAVVAIVMQPAAGDTPSGDGGKGATP